MTARIAKKAEKTQSAQIIHSFLTVAIGKIHVRHSVTVKLQIQCNLFIEDID